MLRQGASPARGCVWSEGRAGARSWGGSRSRPRRTALAVVLALGAAIPILLALGTNLPLYSALWHALPPFRYPRVPERLLPVGLLCLAALVAFACASIGSRV